jgi:hypothetical protein
MALLSSAGVDTPSDSNMSESQCDDDAALECDVDSPEVEEYSLQTRLLIIMLATLLLFTSNNSLTTHSLVGKKVPQTWAIFSKSLGSGLVFTVR